MGNFADKTRSAAKLVVAQLPTVVIDGDTYRVRQFGGAIELYNARARASEIVGLEGVTKMSDGALNMASVGVLVGSLVVGADGAPMLEDNDDYKAWLEYLGQNMALQTELIEKTGFQKWADSIKPDPNEQSKPIDIAEVAEGN